MSGFTKLQLIPVFIRAKDEEELIRKMLSNNHLNGKAYTYMSPYKDGSDVVVWYYADVFNDKLSEKIVIKDELQDLGR